MRRASSWAFTSASESGSILVEPVPDDGGDRLGLLARVDDQVAPRVGAASVRKPDRTRAWNSAGSDSSRSGASVNRSRAVSGDTSSSTVRCGTSPSVAQREIRAISVGDRSRPAPWYATDESM